MAYKGLADFLEHLATTGSLARIEAEVDAEQEIAEITRRVAAQRGPALLFERVRGQSLPVVTNLLGTPERACQALSIDMLDEIAERIAAIAAQYTPQNWFDRLKMGSADSGLKKLRPKPTKTGLCQQVVHLGRDVSLSAFPLSRCWPQETGPGLSGLMLTASPESTATAITRIPLIALDENRLAVMDEGISAFATHWSQHQASDQKMPAALVLGGDPAATIAASLDLPPGLDVLHLVGMLRGKPLDLVKCRTHGLSVPADAELVIEGYLDPTAEVAPVVMGGAGGIHYRESAAAPVFHISAITHRSRAIMPLVIEGGSHGETATLAKARERLLVPALRLVVPHLVDLSLPLYGGLHNVAVVSLQARASFHTRQAAAALWGTDSLRFTKFLFLVDADIDVHDFAAVWSRVGANVSPERDVFSFEGPAYPTDLVRGVSPLARRLAIDATAKIAVQNSGSQPRPLLASEEIRRQVTARWADFRLGIPPG